jgi:Domain of unknown function (DUF1611_C) P-loop domain
MKRGSALRRVPESQAMLLAERNGLEGDVCVFELPMAAAPIIMEAVTGRALTIAPGDRFLGTAGYRESTRWVVGNIPEGGLVPGADYWVLAACGVVGEFVGESPREKGHLGQVRFLGTMRGESGATVNIRQFVQCRGASPGVDHGAPVFLVVGTSSEVGKTTAAINVLRALRKSGRSHVVALKATGTSSVTELHSYEDFGAAPCFDPVDFGLPTTYPSGRDGIDDHFVAMLDVCLEIPADAVLIECGGDILGANVPSFMTHLAKRRPDVRIILAASDSLAALGAKSVLADMGLTVTVVTGPCTDTPTIQQRTRDLCGIPALNMASGGPPSLF